MIDFTKKIKNSNKFSNPREISGFVVLSQICNNHNYRQGGRTISRKRYLFSFSQEELEDRVKHYFENDRFQQKNQKF